ncbi:hypothetical protein C2U70_09050 [Bradyrhizobium guangdongense]|uniref:hypothetical protein n=1 Tax=Bradyrhizobium guangdongense TaxID=1325090 RepID=UPI00112D2288|nr:hypothetical protein [Bradyrhizobium guangdongense]TPQ38377.1 hypothetical protein C2U70_09050 [Bradyrhizobium guangdongense]
MDVGKALTTHLVGRQLAQVRRREFDWNFSFGDDAVSGLSVECPWRIIDANRIAFSSSDDGHKFGLATPLNGGEVALDLLGAKTIERVSIRSDTGDISIFFSNDSVLEVLNMSSGYEGWNIGIPGLSVVATGGGELAIIKRSEP